METIKRKNNKRKFTIITLAVMIGLSLTATIVLAAFTAQKTSTATISFANGLTLELQALDANSAIHINTSAGSQTGVFTFVTTNTTDLEGATTVNGIKAKPINQNAYLGYQVELVEVVSNAEQSVAGSWAYNSSSGVATFTPTGTKTAWKAEMTINKTNFTSVAPTANTQKIVAKTGSALTAGNFYNLFTQIVFDGTTSGMIDDLASRSLRLKFEIKADTTNNISFT